MIFEPKSARDDTCYKPISSPGELFIYLVQHPEEDLVGSDLSLRELLSAPCEKSTNVFVFEPADKGGNLFFLSTTRCGISTTNTLDDAMSTSQKFIAGTNPRQICFWFAPEGKENEIQGHAIMAVLSRYDQKVSALLGLPLDLHENITSKARPPRRAKTLLHPAAVILSLIAGIIVLAICSIKYLITNHPHQHPHPRDAFHTWKMYDTSNSIGPAYQLSINGQNASTWTSYTSQNSQNWTLRLDDQALIPAHLLDPEEAHYQSWFQKRYPEANQIRLNGDYMNETWLSDPQLVDQVPVDSMFHFSHCVLAIKRYVKAKETGRHVCARDVDYEHMKHCLDSLDWWAFPEEGKRGEGLENPKREFWWRTKVCFE